MPPGVKPAATQAALICPHGEESFARNAAVGASSDPATMQHATVHIDSWRSVSILMSFDPCAPVID
jgi:hypothetical protein